MNKNQFNITIIGAGIIGLAIAHKLSLRFKNILVIEKEHTFGQHISSRNSEVVHSGFYYPKKSLKSKLCIEGNQLMYQFVEKYRINYNKCGKLIVSNNVEDLDKLNNIFNNAKQNNVECKFLTSIESKKIEPKVKTKESLWIPSAGIIDSHGVMSRLESLSKINNVSFLYKNEVTSIEKSKEGFDLFIKDNLEYISSNIVINAAGLWAHKISEILGINKYVIDYYKGDYYKCKSINKLNCLIYPIPKIKSLGIHSVLQLNGQVSFGPNIYKVDSINYSINNYYKEEYYNHIKKYFNIKYDDLYPDFSGIRPKVRFENEFQDFVIKNESKLGFENFINLIGIDSPGLTSSLAIAEYVNNLI